MNEAHDFLSSISGPIPLLGVKVQGDILGRGAKIKIFQRFRNQENQALEAIYKFPLPEGAAVCGFRAVIDGKMIQGQVEERNRAFEIYDDALSRDDGGYLLDEERPNIFTLSVGNLNPNSEVMVEIEYVTLLDMEGPQLRFFLPTTISPRYIPDCTDEHEGIPESDKLHPTYSGSVPYGLSVSLNIQKGGLLKSIDSPSHNIKIDNMRGEPINITFSAKSVIMDRDFILNMEYEKSFVSRAYRYQSGQEIFLQLDLLLESEPTGATESQSHNRQEAGKEIIFVLDCSGSMSGDSIREAKKALEICLRGLEPATAFNIYLFGSNYYYLFEKPTKYSKATLEQGLLYLKNADAILGGTEILKPLEDICSTYRANENIERNIFLLTDGEVGNEDQVFELVRKNQKSTRLFSIGIGAGCNEYFIKGLSRAGMGASEFIYPGERIEPKVLRVFSKLTRKGLNNPVIHWGRGTLEQAPVNPAVFLESPVTVLARCTAKDLLTEKITIKGHVNGQEKEWEIDITDCNVDKVPVPILWARERIRDIEESKLALEETGSRQTERKQDRWKETILELSKKYSILSQSTSYVAIEEGEEKDKTTGELVLRKIPLPVTIGWYGAGSVVGLGQSDVMYDMDDYIEHMTVLPMPCAPDLDEVPFLSSFSIREPDSEPVNADWTINRHDSRMDLLFSILSLQKAGAGMEITEEFSSKLNSNDKAKIRFTSYLKEDISYLEVDIEVDKFLLLSTAILLHILEFYFSSEHDIWEGAIRKSKDWMMEVIHEGKPKIRGTDIMTWAERFVRDNTLILGRVSNC